MVTQIGGDMVKRIRIGANGKIVDADRRIHVTRNGPNIPAQAGEAAHAAGPDQVKWLSAGGGPWRISFRYLVGSPFGSGHGPGNPHNIDVPQGAPEVVSTTQPPGTYKYDVLDRNSGNVMDDPDVIIE